MNDDLDFFTNWLKKNKETAFLDVNDKEKVTEWLKELKELRIENAEMHDTFQAEFALLEKRDNIVYIKAINDFANELIMYITNVEINTPNIENKMAIITDRIIVNMANKLKGVKNENIY